MFVNVFYRTKQTGETGPVLWCAHSKDLFSLGRANSMRTAPKVRYTDKDLDSAIAL